jgi:hypothetical protein
MLTGHSEKKRVVGARANPRPFIQFKTYFGPDRRRNVNPNYVGPERRKGGKAEAIRQRPLLDKVLSRSPGSDEENAPREDNTPSVATFATTK